MNTKTIILSSPNEEHTGRGIISIYIEDDLLKCKLRLYNLPKLNPHCKLGVYHNQQVYTANLLEKNGAYESSFVGDFNLEDNFYIALINTQNNNDVIISGGTYAGYYFNMDEELTTPKQETPKQTQPTSTEHTCANCENCIYKQQFYANNQPSEVLNTQEITPPKHVEPLVETIENHNIEQPITENPTPKIEPTAETKPNMQHIINQFNYVFETYQPNQEINALIPNSKFVTINENEEEYSIGVIYKNDKIKYLCYAIKSTYNTPAPTEIGKHYQWLPLDTEDPLSDGYYVVFQDTEDLKILDLN